MCQVGAVWASWMEPAKLVKDRDWSEYPPGTKAHSYSGGAWVKLESGEWRWGSHGGTFRTPGPDAFGRCVELPANAANNRTATAEGR